MLGTGGPYPPSARRVRRGSVDITSPVQHKKGAILLAPSHTPIGLRDMRGRQTAFGGRAGNTRQTHNGELDWPQRTDRSTTWRDHSVVLITKASVWPPHMPAYSARRSCAVVFDRAATTAGAKASRLAATRTPTPSTAITSTGTTDTGTAPRLLAKARHTA